MTILNLKQEEFEKWVTSRPASIQGMIRRLPPDRLYRIGSTGHRATIASYCEDGTVTVNVTGQFNLVAFSRRVFGISPDDLVECDPPSQDEPVGDAGIDPDDALQLAMLLAREETN